MVSISVNSGLSPNFVNTWLTHFTLASMPVASEITLNL
ncbi:hypothetical protein [uncultured Duncaniella sp.]